MPKPEARYTDAQRQAAAEAILDHGLSYQQTVNAAAAGTLKHDGVTLAPFELVRTSIGNMVRKERRRRDARSAKPITELPHKDATELLRRRLLILADDRVAVIERKRSKDRTPGEIREAARMLQQVMALPGPSQAPPPAPGQKVNGTQHGSQIRHAQEGALLTDHRATHGRGTAPTPNPTPETTETAETRTETSSTAHDNEPDTEPADDTSPGHVVRGLAGLVRAPSSMG